MILRGKYRVDGILSTDTHYGLVWKGSLLSDPTVKVAVKMVFLLPVAEKPSGNGKFINAQLAARVRKDIVFDPTKPLTYHPLPRHPLLRKFGISRSKLAQRRWMRVKDFKREVTSMRQLAALSLAPAVFGSWIERPATRIPRGKKVQKDRPSGFLVGFVVNQLCDLNCKQAIRTWPDVELLKSAMLGAIYNLHEAGFTHGDCKPSNIGLLLKNGEAGAAEREVKCLFLDCQKVRRHVDRLSPSFLEAVRHDIGTLEKHLLTNVGETK